MTKDPGQTYTLTQLLGFRAKNKMDIPYGVFTNLEAASLHANVELLLNRHGRASGYLAWALLNKESFVRFIRNGDYPTHLWEWDEGNFIVIVDCIWKGLSFGEKRNGFRKIVGRARIIAYKKDNRVTVWCQRDGRFHLLLRKAL